MLALASLRPEFSAYAKLSLSARQNLVRPARALHASPQPGAATPFAPPAPAPGCEPDVSQTRSHPAGLRRSGRTPPWPAIAARPQDATRLAGLACCGPRPAAINPVTTSTTPIGCASMPVPGETATSWPTVAALPALQSRAIPTSSILWTAAQEPSPDGCGSAKFFRGKRFTSTGWLRSQGRPVPAGVHPGGQLVGQGKTPYVPACRTLDRKCSKPPMRRVRSSRSSSAACGWAHRGPHRRFAYARRWQAVLRPPALGAIPCPLPLRQRPS